MQSTRLDRGRGIDMNECCGTCKYHQFENITDGYVCVNDQSEYVTDWTDYNHCCDEYVERT